MFRLSCPAANTRARGLRRRRGFTLVELLTVIVIISILAAITMSVSNLVIRKQTMAKASTEMDTLKTNLLLFKDDWGEYPPMDNDQGSGSPYAEQNLLMAMTGHARWLHDPSNGQAKWEIVSMAQTMNDQSVLPFGEKYNWGKPYISVDNFTVDKDTTTPTGIKDGAMLRDPWWDGDPQNNAYLYRYKVRNDLVDPANRNWQASSPVLVSRGPDGLPTDADSNFVWKSVNKKSQLTGILTDDYNDPTVNPPLADNLVRSGDKNLP
jgi:prepilin-type N-terminal cleavage/methylation domain-containing protein